MKLWKYGKYNVTGIVRILDDMDMPQTLSEYIMIQICHRYCQNFWWCKYYDENLYYDASTQCKIGVMKQSHGVSYIIVRTFDHIEMSQTLSWYLMIKICHRHCQNSWWYEYVTDIVRIIDDIDMSHVTDTVRIFVDVGMSQELLLVTRQRNKQMSLLGKFSTNVIFHHQKRKTLKDVYISIS